MSHRASDDDALIEALGEAQRLGFLGAAPLSEILSHARRFSAAVPVGTDLVVDLGSGAGVPGLVIAWDRPECRVVLIDRREKRMDAVRRWVVRLGLGDRVEVIAADAGVVARREEFRGRADTVAARGLGPPGVTAELARGFLRPGGVLLVSEPPAEHYERTTRWPDDGLAGLGLEWAASNDPSIACLRAIGAPPVGLPRRHPEPFAT